MARHASGTFEVQGWHEERYAGSEEGPRVTRASVTQAFHGDIEGDGTVEWLMAYRPDGTADFVGMQHISGSLGGRQGTFVLQVAGSFGGEEARGTWSVVPGSGTGELQGLEGRGEFRAPHGSQATATLDYDLG